METNTQLAFTPLYGLITIRADLAKGLGVKIQFDKNGFEEPRAESLTKAQLNMPEQSTAPDTWTIPTFKRTVGNDQDNIFVRLLLSNQQIYYIKSADLQRRLQGYADADGTTGTPKERLKTLKNMHKQDRGLQAVEDETDQAVEDEIDQAVEDETDPLVIYNFGGQVVKYHEVPLDTTNSTHTKLWMAYWNGAVKAAPSARRAAMATRGGWDLKPEGPQPKTTIKLYFDGCQNILADDIKKLAEENVIRDKVLRFKPECLVYKHQSELRLLSSNLFGYYSIYISASDFAELMRLQGLVEDASLHVNYHDIDQAREAHRSMTNPETKSRRKRQGPGDASSELKKVKVTPSGKKSKAKFDAIDAEERDEEPSAASNNTATANTTGKIGDEKRKKAFIRSSSNTVTELSPRSTSLAFRSKSQLEVMGVSATEVGKGLKNAPKGVSYEWLHRSAAAFGDITIGSESMDCQSPQNMVFGTHQANSLMMRYEKSVDNVVKAFGYSNQNQRIAKLTTALRPENDQDTDVVHDGGTSIEDNRKNMKQVWDKNYSWFAPVMDYRVSPMDPQTDIKLQGKAKIHTFTLRSALKLEIYLDTLVERKICGLSK